MYEYQKLIERIHVPEGLNQRVLAKAREGRPRRSGRALVRGAVCAACALAMVLGTAVPRRGGKTPGAVTCEFGLAASAADTEEVNGGVALRWVDGGGRFRVTGAGLETVSLAADRGTLCRDGQVLGGSVTEAFDPGAIYSLSPPEGEDMDSLEGAALTLSAVFSDGGSGAETYRLTAENLRSFQNENGATVLVPALSGDDRGDIPGLYAVGTESRWLCWPVAGSATVSLSHPFGFSPEGASFHTGIDIPGEQGLTITAAAGGTVTKTGFDAQRGNYLILDHGGGLTTLYGQCRELLAAEGDSVEAGQAIALLGSTGMSTGPHLHFEVREEGEAQNPVAYFSSGIRDALRTE